MSNAAIVIDTPEGIQYAQLAAVKGALKLEERGMRHSKLGKIRKPWAVKLGLKPSTKYPELIAHIQTLMNAMLENAARDMAKAGVPEELKEILN